MAFRRITTFAAVLLLPLVSAGAHASGVELVANGGFETGDFTDWTQAIAGSQSITSDNPSSGSFAANLTNTDPAANLLQQFNLGAGSLSTGDTLDLSLDYRGTALAGGVLFIDLLLLNGGGGVSQTITLGPLFPNADPDAWQTFSMSILLGGDVTGGVTLQLNAACGAVDGCVADYFVDNISLRTSVVPVPAAVWLFGSGLLGLFGAARRRG